MSTAEIARQLRISSRTVESHVSSLLRKFAVHDRRALLEVVGGQGRVAADGQGRFAANGQGRVAADGVSLRCAPARNPVMRAELDLSSVIVSVNSYWNKFCVDNGGEPSLCGPGVSYLDICAQAGGADANTVATHIRTAVRGGIFVPFLTRIPCNTAARRRMYDVLVSSRVDDEGRCVGVTVSLAEYVLQTPKLDRARTSQPGPIARSSTG